ncbi:MAG TPA: hypothetical protein VGO17_13135 [Aurantimonas sp.]|jgi:hypothetical protein|nr:hypothetical protein [Aurantimonas sp.]
MTGDGFEAILGGIEAASAATRDGPGRVRTGPGFWSVMGTMDAAPGAARPRGFPGADSFGVEAEDRPQVAPSTDPTEIERDLGIRPGQSPAQLKRLRRAFAGANHPDRMPSQHRAAATIRMQVANRLIDEALRTSTGRRDPSA